MISIILVCFKTPRNTIDCLESIYKNRPKQPFTVWIVNNDKDLVSKEMLTEWCDNHEETHLIISENRGFAAACNLAIKVSKKSVVSQAYWLLNNDCIVGSGCLDSMWEKLHEDEEVGIVGCVITRRDGLLQCIGGGILSSTLCIQKQYGWGRRLEGVQKDFDPKILDFVSGASMLIRGKVVEHAGLLNENFFLYWEETEYCCRAKNLGWKISVAMTANVIHEIGASTDLRSALTDYYSTKNAVIFFRVYSSRKKKLLNFSLFIMISLKLINRVRRGEFKRLPTLIRAFRSGFCTDEIGFMTVGDDNNHDFNKSFN